MAERIHPKTTPRNEQEPSHPPALVAAGTYVNEQAATRAPAAANPAALPAAASVSVAARCFSLSSSWPSPPASSTSSSVPKRPTTSSTTRSASTTERQLGGGLLQGRQLMRQCLASVLPAEQQCHGFQNGAERIVHRVDQLYA
ncbi:hypothetical protein WN943_025399 [Citrus x changshan-huyou]